jgi:hypothetical protein
MGWSCTREASRTMEKFEKWCLLQTGFQNVYNEKGVEKFVEWSREEFQDGSVEGKIISTIGCKSLGRIKIHSNGSIVQGPKFIIQSLENIS